MKLDDLRQKIDGLDEQIVDLLNQRYRVVQEVGRRKQQQSSRIYVPEREAEVFQRLCALNQGPMPNKTLRAIFREVMSGALALEHPLVVAFLGPPTTFTHQAAMAKFGSSVNYIPQKTITEVFESVARAEATYGVVPVENSTEGAVTHTLDKLADSDTQICAEINMAIHHNLLGHCAPKEMTVIYSHPQVFGQCRRWLHENVPGIPLVEVASTTEAAKRCAQEPGSGALASHLAAAEYELPILFSNIEDVVGNTTRFLVLGNQDSGPTGNDKTSLLFVVRDRVGALHESLKPFHEHKISLSMIESRPSRRRNWEYYFFVDILGHISDKTIKRAVDELADTCQFVKVLGSYPRAPEPL